MRILAIETSCDETAVAIADFKHAPPPRRKKIDSQHYSDRSNVDYLETLSSVKVLSNIVSSQVKLHAQFGGVVPNLAKREHQRNLVPILLKSLSESKLLKSKIKDQSAKLQLKIQKLEKILEREPELLKRFKKYVLPLKPPKIDAIAVTYGPGLEPALWVGINFAKALS
ncbi:MAG: hypothetical protein AAB930_02325, partial [Patescibacteria group bacterium]